MRKKKSLIILCSLLLMLFLPALTTNASINSDGTVKFYYQGGSSVSFDPGSSSVRVGDGRSNKKPYVKTLQAALKLCGYNPGTCDGYWGSKTKAALLAYQKAHSNLTNDAVCGKATWKALASQCGSKALPIYPPAEFAP